MDGIWMWDAGLSIGEQCSATGAEVAAKQGSIRCQGW